MQSTRSLVIATLTAAAIPLLAAAARADGPGMNAGTAAAQCVRGCAMQKKACIQTGRTTSLACKQDCRTNSAPQDRGACMKACSSAFRGTKDGCNAIQKACIGDCHPTAGGGGGGSADAATMTCRGGCGQDLADCAKDVVSAAKTCLLSCRSASDRLSCLQGCATDAQSGAGTCASNFQTCGTGCP